MRTLTKVPVTTIGTVIRSREREDGKTLRGNPMVSSITDVTAAGYVPVAVHRKRGGYEAPRVMQQTAENERVVKRHYLGTTTINIKLNTVLSP